MKSQHGCHEPILDHHPDCDGVLHREAVDADLAPVDGLPETLDGIALGRTGLHDRFWGRI
ncbi:hypothetical protein ACFYZB_21260 [Streptomyces sp. NPDC001852]|uniref:hypothetical protein n=1 Tax=Streptomyces sp. NPDC001852 TaxID=3364619 RepID=UPI0036849B2B